MVVFYSIALCAGDEGKAWCHYSWCHYGWCCCGVQPFLANWCNTHTLQARTLSAPQFLIRHVFAGMSQWLCLVLMQSDKRQLPACPLLPVLLSLSALCGYTVVAGRRAHTLLSLKIDPNSAGTDMYGYC